MITVSGELSIMSVKVESKSRGSGTVPLPRKFRTEDLGFRIRISDLGLRI